MSDAFLFHEPDGGALAWVGEISQDDGLYSAVYLSLFGGNVVDSGDAADDGRQWWGNIGEAEESRRLRSRTPHALQLPATVSNLRAVQQAAESDLAWLVSAELADSVDARASAPDRGTCRLSVAIMVGQARYDFTFTRPWGTAAGSV